MAGSPKIVILGAGPTGLGAALRACELGVEHVSVFEKSNHVGGLATSFTDDKGFVWDIGGHVQFSHYKYFDELMHRALGSNWLHHQRESWVWMEGRFIPYPFQNNIRYLPAATRWRCLQGLIRLYKQGAGPKARHFGDWIRASFGDGIAEAFMVPYNLKVWAHPLEMMDYAWVGERVALTDLERVLDNVLHEKDDLSWGPNNTFQFPQRGGTGAIWESVANLVGREHITLNAEVVEIDSVAKKVRFANGAVADYDVLISTIPIDRLVALSGLHQLQEAASKLHYSSSHIIGVGLSGKPSADVGRKCWMYFPEADCPFYRVTVFSNYSPQNVPQPGQQWSLMAEVSESKYKLVDGMEAIRQTLDGMSATKLIDSSHQVLSTWHYRAQYGYPTPTLGRDEVLVSIHAELERQGIYSRGRFGGWKYEVSNQDHSLMQGVELVNRLVLGIPEITYWFPNTANNMAYGKR
jgi:protoporphyrinogen oxidase